MINHQYEKIEDFITGEQIPLIGSEANRQIVERFLVNNKGYDKKDIEIDVDIEFQVSGLTYRSKVDLVVSIDGRKTKFMAIKCAAGSLGSREREIISAARLLDQHPIPYSVVSDGKTAIVLDTISGKKVGEGLEIIPSKNDAIKIMDSFEPVILSNQKKEKEKLIFRSYDSMNVNRRLSRKM